ncbi:uncharacterized protein LOC114193304 [Vigna unguiculata]|uniref:Uncharacterized protein n=1 Tax=Vigna unguiculata TaxID=3917 RepID=A0A4D6NKN5_VIGUN|nr:uncharacterized protein LOC114193304 [Vigna unguiculata]QCE13159.1 hypothetical protein DEO72_LG11g152 [Vigna unguiculata]
MGGEEKKDSQTERRKNEIMGFAVSVKPSGFELMQNCDLPPPSKFLMGPDKSRVYDIAGKGEEGERNKMEVLKALQASQTRAREAEKKAALLKKERECLKIVVLGEAMHLFAYRQQLRLVELQLLHLQQQQQPDGDEEESSSVAWLLALLLSFGIGVTTALSWRYFL